ncbi:UNVERIFIED_CONTAM: hypothetical protein Sradi_4690100 [Sesamum radiatum]|uniref:DC1 domain-containing protein n=1 Tax=Sesamum radiatum TaxID=300843 RepID=A0AAW2MWB9_SESRA
MKYNEISHFSHPHHNLKFEYSEAPFKCDGCKEAGIGSRYKCCGGGGGGYGGGGGGACNFDLHTHCAIPSPSIVHPFYTKCSFQFLSRAPGQVARYCNACEKDVAGFVYHCQSCGFDLHPCCAKLPMVLDDGEIKLYLYKKVREKGEELELQIVLQEVQPTRGVREGNAGGQLARNLLRWIGGEQQQEIGDEDPQLEGYTADSQSQKEQQRESPEMLRGGWFGFAVRHIRCSRGSHHPYCCSRWYIDVQIVVLHHLPYYN